MESNPADVLATLAAQVMARLPEDAPRIARGAALVAHCAVEPPRPPSTRWLVRSQESGAVYTCDSHSCSCPDAQLRERRCKHAYSVVLYQALEDELRYQARVHGRALPSR